MKLMLAGIVALIAVGWAWDALFGGKARAEIEFLDRMQEPGVSDWIREMAVEGSDDRDELIELGYNGCETMGEMTWGEWLDSAYTDMPADFDVAGAGWILYSAGDTLCPEHRDWTD